MPDKTGILGADAQSEVTDYIRTKQLQPDTILALRELVEDLNHEVALYKEFKAVPANQQTNVRNDMYVASEAIRLMEKANNPAFNKAENAALTNYKSKVDKATKFIPDLGQGGRRPGARHGHHGGLETDCGHRRRKDRQGAPDLCAGRLRRTCGHGHHLVLETSWAWHAGAG